jgi:hypothetical protein
MSDTQVEWRTVYGTKLVLFVDGRGVGDFYQAGDGVFRVRLWPHYRLQGGSEQLVLSKQLAQDTLLEMYQWRKQDEAAG